jgi:hypothetical protein
MDPLTMSPDRRPILPRGAAVDAFDAVAWKAPGVRRFVHDAANDSAGPPSFTDQVRALPRWVFVCSGGALSALMGVIMGAAFRL